MTLKSIKNRFVKYIISVLVYILLLLYFDMKDILQQVHFIDNIQEEMPIVIKPNPSTCCTPIVVIK